MFEIQLTANENGVHQSVSCQLDFGQQTWHVPSPAGPWRDILGPLQGSFQIRDNGVMWIWDGSPKNPNSKNTLILHAAPRGLSDVVHRSGQGRIYDPHNSTLKDHFFTWKVTRRDPPVNAAKKLTPIRKLIMDVCDAKLPKGTPFNYFAGSPKNDGANVTNCNIFVGLILQYLQSDRRKMLKKIAGEPFASPRFEWNLYAAKLDKERKPAQSTWIEFTPGAFPKTGDIYQLKAAKDSEKNKNLKAGMTQHIGIIESTSPNLWKTIDGGQKAKDGEPSYACKRINRKYLQNGVIEGEFGEAAIVKGWVDVDRLVMLVPEVFPKEVLP